MNRSRGFTFIEVLAILLVVCIGMTAVIGMLLYATKRGAKTQTLNLAMATAMTVAHDNTPDVDPAVSASWSAGSLPFNDITTPTISSTTKGYINGFYVVRQEVSNDKDIVGKVGLRVYARMTRVTVTVYSQLSGDPITGYSATLMRQDGTP